MTLGTTPIIPLYQVQSDPQARFQRFGRNGEQLFGKPINAELQTMRSSARTAATTPPSQEARATEEARPRTQPYAPIGSENPRGTARGVSANLGGTVDLMA